MLVWFNLRDIRKQCKKGSKKGLFGCNMLRHQSCIQQYYFHHHKMDHFHKIHGNMEELQTLVVHLDQDIGNPGCKRNISAIHILKSIPKSSKTCQAKSYLIAKFDKIMKNILILSICFFYLQYTRCSTRENHYCNNHPHPNCIQHYYFHHRKFDHLATKELHIHFLTLDLVALLNQSGPS